MRRRSPDFWLAVAATLFLICLAGVAYAHRSYVAAEDTYEFHLAHITFSPHAHIPATLNGYAQAADSRLRVQAILIGVTLLATVNVLLQVARRRNDRVRTAAEQEIAEE